MKNNIKVMILHNIISPYRNPLFEELSRKYDLTVYFCKENNSERKWSTKLDKYSFKYKILPYKNIGPFIINNTLKKELKRDNFDVYIIGENPENASSIMKIIKFAKKNKKKIVLWNERINEDILSLKRFNESKNILKNLFYSMIKYFYKKYRKNLYRKINNFISFSEKSSKLLISNGVSKRLINRTFQIMPNILLPKPNLKKIHKIFKNKNIIFNLGYLNKEKGINYLIEAFNKLNREDTVLLIAGTGEEESKLKELAKDNKNIIFLGYKEGVDKANYYSIADFFVFPTLYDCWGLVVNEAFYYGIPVISTNKSGAIELIEKDKTGFIIPDKDTDALANSMKKLLDNPKLLKQMKENVRKIPKSKIVDIQTTVNTFEKAINYAIKNKH